MPDLLLIANTADELGSGTAQQILGIIVVVLAGVIAAMAWYIRKLLVDHKNEIKSLVDDKQKSCQGCPVRSELTKALGDLAKEREDRRVEQTGNLKEMFETAQAMRESVDANTRSQGELASLIKKWDPEV